MTPIDPLRSDAPAIVYIDIKSPYAFLSVGPTRELERDLGLRFDWRPFVLDIPSYLGSARLGKGGEVVEHTRSEDQWAGVKYGYFDCRRYAGLQGLRIRGTEKIWNTDLVSVAMLYLREYDAEALQRFLDLVYPPFWVRELDVEDEDVVCDLLKRAGADATVFREWARNGGHALNRQLQESAFAAGIYGVPTYIVGESRYFGREHLPRVRWQLEGEEGAAPDIAYGLPRTGFASQPGAQPVSKVCIGVDESLDACLALPGLLELLRAYRGEVEWVRVQARPFFRESDNPDDTSRGAMHKKFRRAYRDMNEARYGPVGMAPEQVAPAITAMLAEAGVELADSGPAKVVTPPMPGIAILLDDELFMGRQHLPLLRRRLHAT